MVQEITGFERFADNLPLFIEELRLAGYNVGAGQFISVQELLFKLIKNSRIPEDFGEMVTYLSPILCSHMKEQQDFKNHFTDWCRRLNFIPHPILDESITRQMKKDTELQTELSNVWQKRLKVRLLQMSLFIVMISVLASKILSAKEKILSSWWPPGIFVLAIIMVSFFSFYWWRITARRYLKRKRADKEVEINSFFVKGLKDKIFQSISLFRTSQKFREHISVASGTLDIKATIRKTITKGGICSLVEGRRKTLPEYLILIDRASFQDQQAAYIDSLLNVLGENEVFLTRYYFNVDPRRCYPEKGKLIPFNIKELFAYHPHHRLIIFSDGAGLIEPFTGRVVKWLDQFFAWKVRAIMLLEKDNKRKYSEQVFTQEGFMVMPANEGGLVAFIEKLNNDALEIDMQEEDQVKIPQQLQRGPLSRWLSGQKPDAGRVDKLLDGLREYLGEKGYYWLSACGIYPALNWDLTLFLGINLRDKDDNQLFERRTLLALSRLPWLRYGYMPDWLRERLISDLSIKEESRHWFSLMTKHNILKFIP